MNSEFIFSQDEVDALLKGVSGELDDTAVVDLDFTWTDEEPAIDFLLTSLVFQ